MKFFIFIIPQTLSKIDYHYFCECGRKFVSNKNNEVCKCENGRFFSYDDIKNYNTDLLEIEKIKNGYIAFFEYHVFSNDKIKIERKILFEYRNFLKFQDFARSRNKDKLIAEFVKLCMIKENKWKKYRYIWEKLKYSIFILFIKIHNDKSLIFSVYKENKLKYAIELEKNSKKLIQKCGFENSKVNSGDYKVIVDFEDEYLRVLLV